MKIINTADELRELIDKGPILIDFYATWCGPCKFISPALDVFASLYTNITFVKVDIDKTPDIAEDFGIKSMPTFVGIKNGKHIGKVVGASKEKIQTLLNLF